MSCLTHVSHLLDSEPCTSEQHTNEEWSKRCSGLWDTQEISHVVCSNRPFPHYKEGVDLIPDLSPYISCHFINWIFLEQSSKNKTQPCHIIQRALRPLTGPLEGAESSACFPKYNALKNNGFPYKNPPWGTQASQEMTPSLTHSPSSICLAYLS